MDNYEKYAVSVIIVFGALIIGGLMGAGLAQDKGAFLFALGAAIAAWVSGYAVLFNKPRMYGLIILGAILLCGGSVWQLVT
jgi:hypothetical protein